MTKARTLADFNTTSIDPALLDDTGTIPSALLAGVGGGDNTPAFHAYSPDSFQGIASATDVTVDVSNERFDTDNAFNTSTKRFTPQTAGKYFVYGNVVLDGNWTAYARLYLALNGNTSGGDTLSCHGSGDGNDGIHVSGIIEMNGSSDFVELMIRHDFGGNRNLWDSGQVNYFGAYKIAE